MRLVWLQQWTVLPVVVEDRDMTDDNLHLGRGDPQIRNKLTEKDAGKTTLPQTFIPNALTWFSFASQYASR